MPRLITRAAALLCGLVLLVPLVCLAPAAVAAAEVLQVRSASLLQIGDSNRSYTVELACMTPIAGQEPQAISWLRQQLPRRSRVNLRPLGNRDGILLARVQKIGTPEDVSSGLIQAGLARPLREPPACSPA